MSIKLPRSVKIGPIRFSLRRVKQIDSKPGCWGNVDFQAARIQIKGGINTQHQAVSVMHETIHAILTYIGRDDLNHDEPFIEKLSEGITDALWNSPGLLRYLKEARKE